jgi:hypothetical protein
MPSDGRSRAFSRSSRSDIRARTPRSSASPPSSSRPRGIDSSRSSAAPERILRQPPSPSTSCRGRITASWWTQPGGEHDTRRTDGTTAPVVGAIARGDQAAGADRPGGGSAASLSAWGSVTAPRIRRGPPQRSQTRTWASGGRVVDGLEAVESLPGLVDRAIVEDVLAHADLPLSLQHDANARRICIARKELGASLAAVVRSQRPVSRRSKPPNGNKMAITSTRSRRFPPTSGDRFLTTGE